MQLKILLQQYTEMLGGVSDTPKLDAECLIAAWLNKPRSFFYAYPDHDVLPDKTLLNWLYRRQAGEPVAYIVGEKAFWDMDLMVNSDVLIPRPDTECLVEWVINTFDQGSRLCADLGTGSGAIACAIARERPEWKIIATDQSPSALAVAEHNADKYVLGNIEFCEGDWCHALPEEKFDIIVSNPPYIADSDPALEKNVRVYEPRSALIANQQGLADLYTIAEQAKDYLKSDGVLVVEHGYQQREAVYEVFNKFNFNTIETFDDLNGQPRFTVGWVP